MERLIHSLLYASRWILAPIYLGLIGSLLAILIRFYIELIELLKQISDIKESSMVLQVLNLIDMALIAGLIIMVMLSGFKNFIADAKHTDAKTLGSLGNLSANTLKLQVAAAIVAISSIHLLQIFMAAEKYSTAQALIFIALHLTFVASACLMTLVNKKK